MSLLAQTAAARKERLARIESRAVIDMPINLNRRSTDIIAWRPKVPQPPVKPKVWVSGTVPHPEGLEFLGSFSADALSDAINEGRVTIVHGMVKAHAAIADIQRTVAAAYDVTVSDMISARRTARVVLPRQVAMYLAKELTLRSFPEIGRRFGARDHTTVMHAARKIAELIKLDPELADHVGAIRRSLSGR